MKHMHWITSWLKMTRRQVMNKFSAIPGAFTEGSGNERFVYIKGKRPDKALLVAHADTYWSVLDGEIGNVAIPLEKDGIIFSGNRTVPIRYYQGNGYTIRNGIGINADDRAGCGIAWNCRDLGHSILITSGEEVGCIAAKKLANHKYWAKELNDHQFMIEFDRHGASDAAFYDIGTKNFVEYIANITKFTPVKGFGTDIKYIAKDICGVNLSVGYYNEHTTDEFLVLKQFEHTLRITRDWLSQPNLPKFELDKKELYDFSEKKTKTEKTKKPKNTTEKEDIDKLNSQDYKFNIVKHMVECPSCKKLMGQEKWLVNSFACEHCQEIA